jgi:hypothetical protein
MQNVAPKLTRTQIKTFVAATHALAEAIEELSEVPSGHLYATVCGSISLDNYDKCIASLVGLGWVRKSGHVLHWVGRVPASGGKVAA